MVDTNEDEDLCPKCGGELESGALLDRALNDRAHPLLWIAANQLSNTMIAHPDDMDQIEVDALRCRSCGYLELYAGVGDGS